MECGAGVRRLRATRTSSAKQPLGSCELARRGAVVIVITGTLSEAPAVGGGAVPGPRSHCMLPRAGVTNYLASPTLFLLNYRLA